MSWRERSKDGSISKAKVLWHFSAFFAPVVTKRHYLPQIACYGNVDEDRGEVYKVRVDAIVANTSAYPRWNAFSKAYKQI